MSAGRYWRCKLPHLLGLGFAMAFSAALLEVLGAGGLAAGFLCLVLLCCGLAPLLWEWARKRAFYLGTRQALDSLEEKYLLSELMEEPVDAEGEFFCQVLCETCKAMNDAVGEARRDMAEYREYIEAWVHEVKTPIASARLLLENRPGEAPAALVDELFKIDGYVEQALFYARSGAVERDYLIKAVSLRQVAGAAVKRYARPLIGAGFAVELEGLDATVYADPKWVEFILGQIIANAVQYRGEQPRLRFTQAVEEQRVVLTVADNGVGVDPADLPRIFEKGFTGRNGRTGAAKSTGLGLYLCKKLCARLGLGVWAASEAGRGTAISLAFPKGRFYMAD